MSILTKLNLTVADFVPVSNIEPAERSIVRVSIEPAKPGDPPQRRRLTITFSREVADQIGARVGKASVSVRMARNPPFVMLRAEPSEVAKHSGVAVYTLSKTGKGDNSLLTVVSTAPYWAALEKRTKCDPPAFEVVDGALVIELPESFVRPEYIAAIGDVSGAKNSSPQDHRALPLPEDSPQPTSASPRASTPVPAGDGDRQASDGKEDSSEAVVVPPPVPAAPVYRLEQPFDDARVPAGIEAQPQGPVFPDVEPAPAPGNGSAFTETVMSVIEAASLATGEPPEAITGSSIALLPRIGRLAAVLLLSERGISHDVIGRHFGGRADVKVASLLEAAERSKGTAEFDDCLRKMRAILNGEEVAPVSERDSEGVAVDQVAGPAADTSPNARGISERAHRLLDTVSGLAERGAVLPPNKELGQLAGGMHETVVNTVLVELEEAGRIRRVYIDRDGARHATYVKGRTRVVEILGTGKSTAALSATVVPAPIAPAATVKAEPEVPAPAQKRDLPVLPARGRALSPAEEEMQEVMRGGPAAAAGGVEADFQFLLDKKVAVTRNPGDKTRPFKMNGRPITADDVSASAARLRQITEGC